MPCGYSSDYLLQLQSKKTPLPKHIVDTLRCFNLFRSTRTRRGKRGGRKHNHRTYNTLTSTMTGNNKSERSTLTSTQRNNIIQHTTTPDGNTQGIHTTTLTHNNPGQPKQSKIMNPKIDVLRALIINFQSIWNKKEELANLIEITHTDIIIGTETWLKNEISNNELDISDTFEVYRLDRKRQCKRGEGGIMIAIKKTLNSDNVKLIETKVDSPIMFCKITIKGKPPLIVGAVYRKPDRDIETMQEICSRIKEVSQEYNKSMIWIGGDFNLPDINWENNSIQSNRYPKELNTMFMEATTDSGLQQVVKENTRENSLLDLFFTNHPSHVNKVCTLPGLGDHDIVQVDNQVRPKRKRQVKRNIYMWKQANIPKLKEETKHFVNAFLEKFSIDSDVCEQWEHFTTNTKSILKDNVPQKLTTSKTHQPWINTKTKRLVRKKNKLYLKHKRDNSETTKENFKKIKTETQRECRKAHRNYVNDIVNDESNNNKKNYGPTSRAKIGTKVELIPSKTTKALSNPTPK